MPAALLLVALVRALDAPRGDRRESRTDEPDLLVYLPKNTEA
jgi:hypothetical protein